MIPPPKQSTTLLGSLLHQPCPVHTTIALSWMSLTAFSRAPPNPLASLLSRPLSSPRCPKGGPETPPQTCSPSPPSSPCQRNAFFQVLGPKASGHPRLLSSTHQQILMAPIQNRSRIRPLLIWAVVVASTSVSRLPSSTRLFPEKPPEGAFCNRSQLTFVRAEPFPSSHLTQSQSQVLTVPHGPGRIWPRAPLWLISSFAPSLTHL